MAKTPADTWRAYQDARRDSVDATNAAQYLTDHTDASYDRRMRAWRHADALRLRYLAALDAYRASHHPCPQATREG